VVLSLVTQFLADFTAWASARPDITGAALVGSHARSTATPESDVDLVILAENPAFYLGDTAWAGQFGEAASQQVEEYGPLTSVRVWYASGLEVEFGWATAAWAALPLDQGTREVLAGGARVLSDQAGRLGAALRHAAGI
jgi:predicted nucleotidyltransferase